MNERTNPPLLPRHKVRNYSAAQIDSEVTALAGALAAPFDAAVRLSLCVQRDATAEGSTPSGAIEAVLGEPWLDETLCGLSYRVSPTSFFQMGPPSAPPPQSRSHLPLHHSHTEGKSSRAAVWRT